MRALVTVLTCAAIVGPAVAACSDAPTNSTKRSEIVSVEYRGPVDIAGFDCALVGDSSVVNRICYDAGRKYMIINLTGRYYSYCGIDAATVSSLKSAASKGQYYNFAIKGRFACT